MRSSRAWLLAALVAGGALGCSSPESFVVLVLESTSTPIVNVDQVIVTVSQGSVAMNTLTYPAASLSFGADASASMGTLSVGFSGSQSGDVRFDVVALHGTCTSGMGAEIVTIRRGATVEAAVQLAPERSCPADAGAPDLAPGSTFPGCDPIAASCPSGQSCQIDCRHEANVCATAGTSPPTGSCAGNVGCTAGSECFDYSSLGCPVQICLRLCGSDNDCAPLANNGASGPGSFCRDSVSCAVGDASVPTAYDICSFSCDPTLNAFHSGTTGCPAGLACVIPASMDHVDCACPEATRTGAENTPCTSTAQCSLGLICEQTCRAVCRCDASNGVCTAPNDCPTSGTTCTFVPNQTRYGVCR
jgi:hypothetical protein